MFSKGQLWLTVCLSPRHLQSNHIVFYAHIFKEQMLRFGSNPATALSTLKISLFYPLFHLAQGLKANEIFVLTAKCTSFALFLMWPYCCLYILLCLYYRGCAHALQWIHGDVIEVKAMACLPSFKGMLSQRFLSYSMQRTGTLLGLAPLHFYLLC